jgi:hypothetical protein
LVGELWVGWGVASFSSSTISGLMGGWDQCEERIVHFHQIQPLCRLESGSPLDRVFGNLSHAQSCSKYDRSWLLGRAVNQHRQLEHSNKIYYEGDLGHQGCIPAVNNARAENWTQPERDPARHVAFLGEPPNSRRYRIGDGQSDLTSQPPSSAVKQRGGDTADIGSQTAQTWDELGKVR